MIDNECSSVGSSRMTKKVVVFTWWSNLDEENGEMIRAFSDVIF